MAAQVGPLWHEAGHEVVVYTISNHPEKVEYVDGVKVEHIFNPEPMLGLGGQFIYDLFCILHARRQDFDIILQLGYTTSGIWSWLWPKKKTITNMDGIEHLRAKYRGPLAGFLRWSERRAAKRSKLLVADNPEIGTYLKKYKTPQRTIAYGTKVVSPNDTDKELIKQFGLRSKWYHLHIGRVQPDNHVEEILTAAKISGKTLVAVGDYTTSYGKKLKKKFEGVENIKFVGTIYDKATINALRLHAMTYIHGHSAGGTNPALLEALGCGCFVLAHSNPFNASVLGGLGGLWHNSAELVQMLKRRPTAQLRREQAAIARERMKKHFNWPLIAGQYLEAFQEVSGKESKQDALDPMISSAQNESETSETAVSAKATEAAVKKPD
jgi:glycosyltransferase involved in cell wall biosynthesis